MSKRNSGNNPEEKTDLRIRRTKKSIRDAFFELIDENGFDSVTVKDITDRALISRNTFYLHYEDKFDLLNKISNELMRKVYWRVSKDLIKIKDLDFTIDCTATLLISIQRVIDEDRDLYRLLLTIHSRKCCQKKSRNSFKAVDWHWVKRHTNGKE